jgi:hypothetical protein
MDIITLATAAVGYLISEIKGSKGVKLAGDEMSSAIWQWVRPLFLKDDTPIQDLIKDPESKLNQEEVALKIKKYLTSNPQEVETLTKMLEKVGVNSTGNTINMSGATIFSGGNTSITGGNIINQK